MSQPQVTQPADAFIGRRDELEAIDNAFTGRCRVVTITGHGGIGKTRLALEYAAMRADPELGDLSVQFIELSEARSLDALVDHVALSVDVPLDPEQDPLEQVGAALATYGELLVVLDNLEQVIDAAAQAVRMWRLAAPEVRFLVTSRIPLGLGGEQRIDLEPLAREDSVALFEVRAQAADYQFAVSDADAEAFSEIVARLDGIPLAIELAAARTVAMSIASLSTRLAESFDVLRSARRDMAPRQATMSSAIEWSWELLPEPERDALAQLSVFVGGFSATAASAVIERDAEDVVRSLHEQSLLIRQRTQGSEMRFRLYEPVREHMTDKLDADALREARDRHAEHFLTVARTVSMPGAAYGTCGTDVIARAFSDIDNLVAAFEHSLDTAPAIAAEIGLALVNLHQLRDDPPHRQRRMIDAAVDAADRSGDDELRCRLRIARAAAHQGWRELQDIEPDLHEAQQLAQLMGSAELEGLTLFYRGLVLCEYDRLDDSRTYVEQAVDLLERAGKPYGLGRALECLALLGNHVGDAASSHAYRERALEAHRAANSRRAEAISLRNRADMLAEAERLDEALADTETAFRTLVELGTRYQGITMMNLAQFSAQAGDLDRARELIYEMLDAARHGLLPQRSADPFFVAGWVELVAGDPGAAEDVLNEGIAWSGVVSAIVRPNRLIARGAARLLTGRVAAARDDLCAAIEVTRANPKRISDASVAASFLAAVEYAAERFDQVWPWLAVARAEAARWGQPRHHRVLAAIQTLFEPAAEAPDEGDRKPFLEEIAARQVVETIRAGLSSSDAVVARLGPDAEWLQLPGADERIDLGKRPMLQRIIRQLVAAHRNGRTVSSAELIAAVWPDDRSDRRSIENRLWVAMSALRRLGLADVIRKQRSGYCLDPDLTIEDA